MNYNRNISEKELSKMTTLSCDVINSINFTEAGPLEERCARFAELLNGLESRYGSSDLIARARFSFNKLSRQKMDFYRFTRDMIRMTKDPIDYTEISNDPEYEQLN